MQYYLIAQDFEAEMLLHFRLDRITKLNVAFQPVEGDTELNTALHTDVVRQAREHPHMYSGRTVTILIKMPRFLAGAVYDNFGVVASMTVVDDKLLQVRVRTAAEGMRFFALQYGPNSEVLEPESLREQIKGGYKEYD